MLNYVLTIKLRLGRSTVNIAKPSSTQFCSWNSRQLNPCGGNSGAHKTIIMATNVKRRNTCLSMTNVRFISLSCTILIVFHSRSKLFALCALEPVQTFMRHVDMQFYQNLVQVLLPDVLRPIPSTLTQAIRNFAKSKVIIFPRTVLINFLFRSGELVDFCYDWMSSSYA